MRDPWQAPAHVAFTVHAGRRRDDGDAAVTPTQIIHSHVADVPQLFAP